MSGIDDVERILLDIGHDKSDDEKSPSVVDVLVPDGCWEFY